MANGPEKYCNPPAALRLHCSCERWKSKSKDARHCQQSVIRIRDQCWNHSSNVVPTEALAYPSLTVLKIARRGRRWSERGRLLIVRLAVTDVYNASFVRGTVKRFLDGLWIAKRQVQLYLIRTDQIFVWKKASSHFDGQFLSFMSSGRSNITPFKTSLLERNCGFLGLSAQRPRLFVRFWKSIWKQFDQLQTQPNFAFFFSNAVFRSLESPIHSKHRNHAKNKNINSSYPLH